MKTAMQEAMIAATTKSSTTLARQIMSVEQVALMSTDDLIRLNGAHESECVSLAGKIETSVNDEWAQKARRALRALQLHRVWIARELKRRKQLSEATEQKKAKEEEYEEKRANRRMAYDLNAANQRARMERIQASQNRDARRTEIFREVAREVLGAEMYAYLWELAQVRINAAEGGAV